MSNSNDNQNPPPVTQNFPFPAERQKAVEAATAQRSGNQRAQPAVMNRGMEVGVGTGMVLNGQPVGQSPVNPGLIQRAQPTVRNPHMAASVPPVQGYVTHGHGYTDDVAVVSNDMPIITNGISDGEYSSLALPSRFRYYGFTDLYVKPFSTPHMAKLSRAHAEKSLQPVVEVVSSVLRTSTPGFEKTALGFQLSVPDFFFVMYWLRLNSYTKSNYIHRTTCKDPAHLAEVKEGLKSPETLDITKIVTKSDIVIVDLDEIPDPEVYKFSESSEMVFRPAIMKDTLEFMDDPRFLNPQTREEFAFVANLASFIQHKTLDLPLSERVNIINAASNDDLQLITDFSDLVKDFGVVESIHVNCKECGASRVTKLTIDAHSFLPTHRPARNNGTQNANRVGI